MKMRAKQKIAASKRKKRMTKKVYGPPKVSLRDKVKSGIEKMKAKRKSRKETRAAQKKAKNQKSAAELHAAKRKKIGASKDTKVSKGAVGLKKTKGGEYVKYEKKSRAAGSFRKAFKSKCAGGAKGFTWQGRKYSCAKK